MELIKKVHLEDSYGNFDIVPLESVDHLKTLKVLFASSTRPQVEVLTDLSSPSISSSSADDHTRYCYEAAKWSSMTEGETSFIFKKPLNSSAKAKIMHVMQPPLKCLPVIQCTGWDAHASIKYQPIPDETSSSNSDSDDNESESEEDCDVMKPKKGVKRRMRTGTRSKKISRKGKSTVSGIDEAAKVRKITESEEASATSQLAETQLAKSEGRFVDLSEVFVKHKGSTHTAAFIKDAIKVALPKANISFSIEKDSQGNERHYFVTSE